MKTPDEIKKGLECYIDHVAEGHVVNLMQPGGAEALADHLIANGVVVQTSKNKPLTDLTGKCGSCTYARPTVAFGGSKCYVACTNPEKRFKVSIAHLRQRTCKACKKYKPLPELPKEETK